MSDVKEHGFLFKAEMILAILDGRKTMTRRVCTPHNSLIDGSGKGIRDHWKYLDWSRACAAEGMRPDGGDGPYWRVPCSCMGDTPALEVVHQIYPRVQVGDNIYAKETWAAHWMYNDVRPSVARSTHPDDNLWYRADGDDSPSPAGCPAHGRRGSWRSPLYMPRWAARIVRPVVRVGAERVGDISEADAIAEGLTVWRRSSDLDTPHYGIGLPDVWETDPRETFRRLWDGINGAKDGRSFADSPPAWAYEWDPWVAA